MKTTSTRSLVLLAGLAVASQSAFAFPPPVTNVGLMPGDLAIGPAANAQSTEGMSSPAPACGSKPPLPRSQACGLGRALRASRAR